MKNCIRKTVGRLILNFEELRSILNFEELCTLLIEVEATPNNRPLTYMYDDENGISYPLTPASLIYGRRISHATNEPHTDVTSTACPLTKRAKYHYNLLNQFNKQWSKEYLLDLREKSWVKSTKQNSSTIISVGDMVLIWNEGMPKCFWNLAKVSELISSKDNKIRSVWLDVVTDGKTKKLRRPLKMLTALEVNGVRDS